MVQPLTEPQATDQWTVPKLIVRALRTLRPQ